MRIHRRVMSKGSVIFSLAAGLAACGSNDTIDSKDVNPEALYGEYTADFNADAGREELFVQFRVGGSTGTTVRLNDPAKVEANSQRLLEQGGTSSIINLIGTYYGLTTYKPAPEDSVTFVWTRDDKKTFQNVVVMAKPVSIGSPEADLKQSRKNDLKIEVTGDELLSGETFEAELRSQQTKKDETTVTILWKRIQSGRTIIFAATDLNNFATGAATLVVRRLKPQNVQQGHDREGGVLSSRFQSKAVSITMTE